MELIRAEYKGRTTLFNAATVNAVDVADDRASNILAAYIDGTEDRFICVDRNGNPCALGDAIVTTDEFRKPQTATAEYSGGYDLRTAAAVLRWLARWYDDDCHIVETLGDIVDLDEMGGVAAKSYAEKILADIEQWGCTSGD